ncbi:hypothetical protein G7K_6855-t1 [Saitoella complicata NRRL Y-17804]|uniref:Uncharacterized protein n=1 Tax=Saitoella complicata (strain BCRC 22490 / CBS 7301 / JCM 7358 / NBRC 10748 / NRRL Y-17804) TaxID=698492 RepID=A0A0E9NSP8_SAICN|nr:hypothetical protein G7K_6855-t1 [Saitoella complicata NRRL Y-17804]
MSSFIRLEDQVHMLIKPVPRLQLQPRFITIRLAYAHMINIEVSCDRRRTRGGVCLSLVAAVKVALDRLILSR